MSRFGTFVLCPKPGRLFHQKWRPGSGKERKRFSKDRINKLVKILHKIQQNREHRGMPRDLVLGNGNVLINFDHGMNMRDLFYPGVGMDNHIAGHRCGIGFWEDGYFSWLDEGAWDKKPGYQEDTLVTEVQASNHALGLTVQLQDAVHYRCDLFLRRLRIANPGSRLRTIRIFFYHDLSLNGSEVGDTALYDPALNAVCHYKRDRCFLIGGLAQGRGIFQYATGLKRFGTAEGTWRDAEDGWLEGNPIAHGSVDSSISFELLLQPGAGDDLWYWIAMGRSFDGVRRIHSMVLDLGPAALLEETASFWRRWVHKQDRGSADLPDRVGSLFRRSLLVVRTQCDNRGAILAANDTDIMTTARDHYSYMWPRDGAMIAMGLDRAGYPEIPLRFFEMCVRVLSEDGYYFQKYNADGTPGSSWHPWVGDGARQLPIQEDETALVIHAMWCHYLIYRDYERMEAFYRGMIRRAADFLECFRHPGLKLPLESYDLWEERRGIFSFTAAAVHAGLKAAANFAELFGDLHRSSVYRRAAREVREGMERHLYCSSLGRFLRGACLRGDELVPDQTLDASLYGLFAFGVFPAGDPRVARTMEAVEEGLWVKTRVGGLARYTGDWYFRKSDDIEKVPGNPWFLTTTWLAEWYTARAGNRGELERARKLLEWVAEHSMESGILPEQVHPYSGKPLSVAPLTWSHGAFILAVINYLDRFRELDA
jgi:GH15 family glucan-1,4-alpha-glucosidase